MSPSRFLLAAASLLLSLPAFAAQEDEQVWLAQFSTIEVGDKVLLFSDVQFRLTDGADRLGQVLLRPAVGYRITPSDTLFVGYAYVRTEPLTGTPTDEHRMFQQALVRIAGKPGKVTVTGRTRLEQRWLEGRSDMGWRVRQMVRVDVPTRAGVSAIAWAEPFVNLDTTTWGQRAGFDQLRVFGGVGVPLARGIALEAGYSGQYVNRFNAPDRMNHIGSLALTIRR
ncbi:MAG: hypothetical protein B7Y31_02025 [Novosphingobium sp. 16-62-11]|uniref:DUF2490 domain-containing protein n=1 Tax=Novosphingobium sp. 17-62-19 TaxID=1970406 RepID=UPI000BD07467|nr:DUF2490 domain-containing protein [Novosphingobium sp. 17-62-19]OYX96534.1 MAG: hypothetical protein B7Y74_00990 [Novosphingobium sp. 35-62-5]OYZ45113.1 MAG: hypothetical protein B7Y31_02025 [Novosphingobium sp. 16-62-11]OZA21679.1 MAG: hypothetical protein B7X90_00660 [Novosphingobium sp. 17-62-19]HQS95493.1 DUF2490 domain-containing protein [Novosphingobium sp.]